MSTIKDIERQNHQQIENLKRRQSRETKALESGHQAYKSELKKTQESEILDLQDENQRQIANEAEKKERVLSDMRTHLQNSQRLTDKELRSLKETSELERNKIKEKLVVDRERVVEDGQLHLEEVNDRLQTESRKVNYEGKNQITDMKNSMQEQYADQQQHLQKKINDQAMTFTTKYNHETKEHKNLMDQTVNKNKLERISVNQRQQTDLSKMVEAQTLTVEQRDVEFRKGLKEQDAFFEKKYQVNHASHSKDANNLDERFHGLMNKMKLDLAKELTKTEERLDDPFYHFTELRPTWQKTEDGIEIKVTIPDYSKKDLQLTTNGKTAILNFNRRYKDSNETSEGIDNKIDKVETFTARIKTDVNLNPKTVESSFADGVMTYKIKKS